MNLKFHLFEKGGKEKTSQTLDLAKKNADILGIKDIIMASTTGYTAEEAIKVFDPSVYRLIIVTHAYGFRKDLDQEFDIKIRKNLEQKNVKVFSGTHVYSGIGPSIYNEWKHMDLTNIFAKSIRKIFSDGVKVCHEIVMMATDTGLIPIGTDVISIGGTGRGADTVCWITASSSRNFLNARIKAILVKPQ
jgi:hypothetical protein